MLKTKSYDSYRDISSLAFIDISAGKSSTRNIDYAEKLRNTVNITS